MATAQATPPRGGHASRNGTLLLLRPPVCRANGTSHCACALPRPPLPGLRLRLSLFPLRHFRRACAALDVRPPFRSLLRRFPPALPRLGPGAAPAGKRSPPVPREHHAGRTRASHASGAASAPRGEQTGAGRAGGGGGRAEAEGGRGVGLTGGISVSGFLLFLPPFCSVSDIFVSAGVFSRPGNTAGV